MPPGSTGGQGREPRALHDDAPSGCGVASWRNGRLRPSSPGCSSMPIARYWGTRSCTMRSLQSSPRVPLMAARCDKASSIRFLSPTLQATARRVPLQTSPLLRNVHDRLSNGDPQAARAGMRPRCGLGPWAGARLWERSAKLRRPQRPGGGLRRGATIGPPAIPRLLGGRECTRAIRPPRPPGHDPWMARSPPSRSDNAVGLLGASGQRPCDRPAPRIKARAHFLCLETGGLVRPTQYCVRWVRIVWSWLRAECVRDISSATLRTRDPPPRSQGPRPSDEVLEGSECG
jgi:hypothetical protein